MVYPRGWDEDDYSAPQVQKLNGAKDAIGIDKALIGQAHEALVASIGLAPGLFKAETCLIAKRWLAGRVVKPGHSYCNLQMHQMRPSTL
jgi:hypothetical protein